MSALSRSDIESLIKASPPLIEGYLDLNSQLQPNGFDATVRSVAAFDSPGVIAEVNAGRQLPALAPLAFDSDGGIELAPGPYMITLNEIVSLPNNVMALARPRSSLLRCGVTVGTAVWDAGYSGRSQCLLVVYNPHGFRLQKNARVAQFVFFKLTGHTIGYNGIYQGENK